MDFNLNEEQQSLVDTLARWLDKNYSLAARRALTASPLGFSEDNWRQLANLGVLGINVPEEYGGLGYSPVETFLAMREFGRALLVEPFALTAIVAAALIAHAEGASQRETLLTSIVEGSHRFSLAAIEPQGNFDLDAVETVAYRSDDAYIIDGCKTHVEYAAAASHLIVSARVAAAGGRVGGIALFLVGRDSHGVHLQDYPTLDGLRASELRLERVRVGAEALLVSPDCGLRMLEWAVDRGIAAGCAEAVGAMERLTEMTAEHLKNRRQFGAPLASFQALQHHLADMLIAVEQARSMALVAAARADEPERIARRMAISAAKLLVARSSRRVGELAVQLHGAMGMTDELAVGHYFKRLLGIEFTWGDSVHHTELCGGAYAVNCIAR